MNTKGKFIGFRLEDEQIEKLNRLVDASGLNQSAVMRALVDAANVKPVQWDVAIFRTNEQGRAVNR
jgi:hypothetical protein